MTMNRLLVSLVVVAVPCAALAQEVATNQIPAALLGIQAALLQSTNATSPTFGIFSAADDAAHGYIRNRAAGFIGNTIGGTGIDLTAIPVFSDWDGPPPVGGNPYGGARFNGILVTPDILLQAHHPWADSGYDPKTIYFVDNRNQTVAATVAGHRQIGRTDIEVVRLAKKVPMTIMPAIVLTTDSSTHTNAPDMHNRYWVPSLWTDQFRELYIGVTFLAGNSTAFVHQTSTSTPFSSYWATGRGGVVGGDSGAPYMTIINGRLVALGTWTTGGKDQGGGSSFADQVPAINAVIKALGSGTTLETVNVDLFR
jgi:hypothetical protein